MQNFRNLVVWQRAHELVLEVYRSSARFPTEERFGVTSQLRRASVSVPANIAEGARRRSGKDYAHFLNIAQASLAEVEYLLLLSRDLGYLQVPTHQELEARMRPVAGMLEALRRRVEASRTDHLGRVSVFILAGLSLAASAALLFTV
ncbi:MAG: four helix bundle protein [Planctomycetota bacterium]